MMRLKRLPSARRRRILTEVAMNDPDLLTRFRGWLEKYLLLALVVLAAAAYFWARLWPSGPNPFSATRPI